MTGPERTPDRPHAIGERLRVVAAWLDCFDDKRGYDGPRDVQRDLRADAHKVEEMQKLLLDAAREIDHFSGFSAGHHLERASAFIARINVFLGDN